MLFIYLSETTKENTKKKKKKKIEVSIMNVYIYTL